MYITMEQVVWYFIIGFVLGMIPTMLVGETDDMFERIFILTVVMIGWGVMLVLLIGIGIPFVIITAADFLVSLVRR